MKCPSCGAELPSKGGVCPECRATIKIVYECPTCGAELPLGANSCPSCGQRIFFEADSPATSERAGRKRNPNLLLIIGLLAAFLFCCACLFCTIAGYFAYPYIQSGDVLKFLGG